MGTAKEAVEADHLQLFEICLHREEYFPGEVVTGKLLIVTSRPLKTEGIYIKFEGKGSVRWKNRSSHLCGLQEAEFVHEKRKYFSNVFRYDLDTLPEGCSVLTFEFELPIGIPQSIEPGRIMKQLKIVYSLEALIRTINEDYQHQKCFAVKGIYNLNAIPELSLATCKTVREPVFESCWSSSGRALSLNFLVKKQGFVPGEQIQAELLIKDDHHIEAPVLGVEVHLIQEIDLKIRTASRVRNRIVATCDMVHAAAVTEGAKENGHSSKKCHQRKLSFFVTIPDDILISYGNTDQQVHDFISIRYFLRMTMERTSFPYKPLQINLPVKIGTVMIREQKFGEPIRLLEPVPLALPRPKAPIEKDSSKQNEKSHPDFIPETLPSSTKVINSVPQISLNNKKSLSILEQPKSSSSSKNVSPRTPKRRPGNAKKTVVDSSGCLKPLDAFGGGDSDSESFRSGIEELQQP